MPLEAMKLGGASYMSLTHKEVRSQWKTHHIMSRALGQKATVSAQNPYLQVETQGRFSVPLLPAYKTGMGTVLTLWSQGNTGQ